MKSIFNSNNDNVNHLNNNNNNNNVDIIQNSKIFNYSWELTNASPDSSDPTALSEAATAITEAHKAFANAFKGLGATVDESKHSFTINGGSESQNKLNVQAAVLQAKAILLTGATQKLNKDARIIVKQGSKEIHNSKLGEV